MPKVSEFRYDPETGKLWREAGTRDPRGYFHVQFQGEQHLSHRVAWFLYYGKWPDLFVDHINGNPSDNRIVNLRLATRAENGHNRGKARNNTSGFKGVSRHVQGHWQAIITVRGKAKFLGSFATREAASTAYQKAALAYHGEFANIDL